MEQINLTFRAGESSGDVSALMLVPPDARVMLVFAHGAGADMRYDFMESMARELYDAGIATFRFNFPYMEHGRKIPDPQAVLTETILSAIAAAGSAAPDLPLFAGGKSLGGRMTSLAALPQEVRGIVFFGFPLHAPGQPSTERAGHLFDVSLPMLFLQGTRDPFTEQDLLRHIIAKIGGKATLHIVEGAEHSFHMLKSSALADGEVVKQLARVTKDWLLKNIV
ncbi:MAG: dienelactone hydrolase family protein [Spirochaetes bacterium]|nr:dienelactone hydrolase family protein [Spirochaetota bacterium]